MSRRTSLWAAVVVLLAMAQVGVGQEDRKLRTLPASDRPRFEVTDRVWPAKVGEAAICLWHDDAMAAVSITIDDNWAPNHAWWLEVTAKYGVKVTWFVITGRVDAGNAFFGTWKDFAKLKAAGHDIQSHTVNHFGAVNGEQMSTEQEYKLSIEQLEKNLPGHKVRTLAYPGGQNAKNDKELAAKMYIACRGVAGSLNAANQVDYNSTNSLSGTMSLDGSNRVGLPKLLEKPTRPGRTVWRGWASIHFHGVTTPEKQKEVDDALKYLTATPGEFWVAPFTEVAMYGQQRDTAEVASKVMADGRVSVTVTDRMDDELFDFPLSVKVRVSDTWTKAAVKQGEQTRPAKLVEHAGGKYALVGVVPDRGEAIVGPE